MQHIPGAIGITKQLAHPSPSSKQMKRSRSAEPSEPSRNRSHFIEKYKEYLDLCFSEPFRNRRNRPRNRVN